MPCQSTSFSRKGSNGFLTASVRHVVNISRIFPLIRHWDRVSVFVKIYVGPSFLGGVMFVLIIRGNLGRTGIRGNIATMYRFFAGVVALKGTTLTSRCVHKIYSLNIYLLGT